MELGEEVTHKYRGGHVLWHPKQCPVATPPPMGLGLPPYLVSCLEPRFCVPAGLTSVFAASDTLPTPKQCLQPEAVCLASSRLDWIWGTDSGHSMGAQRVCVESMV